MSIDLVDKARGWAKQSDRLFKGIGAILVRELADEVERLTPYVEAVRLAGNLARAVEECIGGGDIAMRGHALNALHAYLAHLTEHNLLPEDKT